MRIRCSQCQAALNVQQREAAFKVRCPKCTHAVVVPAEELDNVEVVDVPTPTKAGGPKSKKTPPASKEKSDEKPKKKKRKSQPSFTVLYGVIAGAATLVLVGGGTGVWLLLRPRPIVTTPPPVIVTSSPIVTPTPKGGAVDTRPLPKNKLPLAHMPPGEFKLQRVETAAVIDRSGAPAGTLFETKMLQDTRLKWVERAALDQVFAEQNLQAIFSPEGVASRTALGKLIKADVIAVVRKVESPDKKGGPLLDLVVFDVRSGLRLMTTAAPENGDQAAIAGQFQDAFQQCIVKLDAKIVDVCAVPTFLNQDLAYHYTYMAGGLARSVEGHLNHRQGLLLVELAEAKSLSQEAAIGGTTTVRPLPLFVLGEYRNQGADKNRRVSVKLTLKRGEKHLGDVSRDDIAPDAINVAMKDLSEKLLAKGEVAGEQLVINPKSDVLQLANRALTLRRVGQWHDSAALYEAAIAIDPTDRDLRLKAADVSAGFIQQRWNHALGNMNLAFECLQMYRRGMEHVDIACRPPGPRAKQEIPSTMMFDDFQPTKTLVLAKSMLEEFGHLTGDAKFKQFYLDTVAADRQIMIEHCRLRARLGYNDEMYALRWAVDCTMQAAQKKELILSMISELKDLPHGKNRVAVFAMMQYRTSYGDLNFKHVRLADDAAYLTQLENHTEAVYRDAAKLIRDEQKRFKDNEIAANEEKDREKKEMEKLGPPPLEAITITAASGSAKVAGKEIRSITKIIPLPGGEDLIVASSGLYLMKKKGVADQILNRTPDLGGMYSPVFDGRYVWFAALGRTAPPRLMYFDVEKKTLKEISPAEGLPMVDAASLQQFVFQTIDIAPLEKGKVLVVGFFGRTWIGIATADAVQGKKVTIFHEAREPSDGQGGDEWKRATIAFQPRTMHIIEPPKDMPEAGQRRIVIARETSNNKTHSHALVVDPDAKTVAVDPNFIDRQHLVGAFLHEGSLYFPLGIVENNEGYNGLIRYEFPGRLVKLDINISNWQRTALRAIDGDDLYLNDEKGWLIGSLSKKTLQPVSQFGLASIGRTSRSNHFGLIVPGTILPQPPTFPQPRSTLLRIIRNPESPVIAVGKNP